MLSLRHVFVSVNADMTPSCVGPSLPIATFRRHCVIRKMLADLCAVPSLLGMGGTQVGEHFIFWQSPKGGK